MHPQKVIVHYMTVNFKVLSTTMSKIFIPWGRNFVNNNHWPCSQNFHRAAVSRLPVDVCFSLERSCCCRRPLNYDSAPCWGFWDWKSRCLSSPALACPHSHFLWPVIITHCNETFPNRHNCHHHAGKAPHKAIMKVVQHDQIDAIRVCLCIQGRLDVLFQFYRHVIQLLLL